MKRLPLLLFFLLGLNYCFAQQELDLEDDIDLFLFNPEVEIGLSIPTSDLVSKVYNQGITGAIGISFKLWKGLTFKPNFQYRYYMNQFSATIDESLRINSISGSIGYTISIKEVVKVKLEVGLGNATFRNVSKFTYSNGKEGREEMMDGDDLFYDFGLSIYYKRLYLKTNYQLLDAVPTFNQDIQNGVTEHPSLYQLDYIVDKELDLNNLSLTLGFKFL